ncbi:hypothetical protein I8U18_17010 [Thermoactinomyces sp. CICC 10522]|nr:hypothetical protein [Thermoactinomyces sp. CICC 10522]
MCILCGNLMTQVHWTDQKRRYGESAEVEVGGQVQRDYVRERWKRIRILNVILSHYALEVRDWNNTQYIVADKKGNTLMGVNLEDIWSSAGRLAGRRIDPLDPSLIRYIKQKREFD